MKIANPEAHLLAAQAEDYKTYLLWRRDDSRVARENSIERYWKTLSMHYMRAAKRYMDEGIMLDIKNVCYPSRPFSPAILTSQQWIPTLGLDNSQREKEALYVEDMCVLQNGHWVRDRQVFPHERLRVQESPLMIFAGATATRPAALVGKRPLLYEDIEFQVFPPPAKGLPPAIIMVLNLKNIKRSGGTQKP
jgi:hypothetical protein